MTGWVSCSRSSRRSSTPRSSASTSRRTASRRRPRDSRTCQRSSRSAACFEGLNDELDGHGNLGWSEIAARLSVNEKTAKREYLRALHILLRETAQAIFGLNITSNYVKRVLDQLRRGRRSQGPPDPRRDG